MLPKHLRRAIFLTKKGAKIAVGAIVPTIAVKRARFYYATLRAKAGKDYFPANDGLDQKLLAYVGDIKRGVFIEAGVNDGISQSNTWHLEKRLGWTGLLVEPVPHLAALCRRFRSKSRVENCALGGFEDDGQEITMHFGGLMTVAEGADTTHMFGGSLESHAKSGAGWSGDKSYSFKSRLYPISALLLKNGFKRADLLCLDVEGFEVQALSGLDVAKTPVTFILVETSNLPAVQAALERDYSLIGPLSRHDYLFKLNHPEAL